MYPEKPCNENETEATEMGAHIKWVLGGDVSVRIWGVRGTVSAISAYVILQ